MIPSLPSPLARKARRRRNVIERPWSRPRNWRRIAPRYGRLARDDLAGLALASFVVAWTRMESPR